MKKYKIVETIDYTSNGCSCCEPVRWETYTAYDEEGNEITTASSEFDLMDSLLAVHGVETEWEWSEE